ncbi:MoaD/ThiS family protein [Desulforamulus aquiferis]|uniref:MoaD/ThiS family protein n=1 Tax=Desulforamulus aquiferis TaxID=1397668 RepID=A0AAW7ZFR2_9FIRM|nr:MoaD/ThiS family protein [Desulforamulus aquiferis]MDO7788186.1 MoaD/ThiS family protein [Desulforamulus aquiferis]
MKVQVKLLGILSLNFPAYSKFKYIEIKAGEQVEDLFTHLGLASHEVHYISVNGKLVKKDYFLKDDDKVIFFPQVSGG